MYELNSFSISCYVCILIYFMNNNYFYKDDVPNEMVYLQEYLKMVKILKKTLNYQDIVNTIYILSNLDFPIKISNLYHKQETSTKILDDIYLFFNKYCNLEKIVNVQLDRNSSLYDLVELKDYDSNLCFIITRKSVEHEINIQKYLINNSIKWKFRAAICYSKKYNFYMIMNDLNRYYCYNYLDNSIKYKCVDIKKNQNTIKKECVMVLYDMY